ncbi:MAG: DUF1572 domain-containing protein [Acidobacteriota bacterium]|nr:DUF1572 domain-containing protein [Acidobacteriota bacterium]
MQTTTSSGDIGEAYLIDAIWSLRSYKKLAEAALSQISDRDLFRLLDPEANSIAMLVKHMAGNMRSRWTNFLTTDGEKPDRHRDQEFGIEEGMTRADVMKLWEGGWTCVLESVSSLRSSDLDRRVYIAEKEHTALQAINRQLLHYAGHVNQIIMLAKHFAGPSWRSLSIPKGQSETFAKEFEKLRSGRE